MSYRLPDGEDEVLALLKHSDRVRIVNLHTTRSPQWGKVVAAMQEPFPVLTRLELSGIADHDVPVLPGEFLGGSAPCLQQLVLYGITFPELPTLLLSARDLVSLRLNYIPPTGYISPEAMVAGLAVLTKLKTLHITFFPRIYRPEQMRRRLDPSMRVVLPALTYFQFIGCSEYLEDLVAQIDAPRLHGVHTDSNGLDFPQLSQFICRTENLRFRRANVEFNGGDVKIELRVDRRRRFDAYGGPEPVRPHFGLSTSFEWSDTRVAHLAFVLSRIFAMCFNVEYLAIGASDDHSGWHDYIDNTEWLAFFRLLTTVETLYIYGRLARQVARALENVPKGMITEMLPSLHLLMLEDPDGPADSAERFVSLRQLYGRPVTIRDTHNDFEFVETL